MGPEGARRGSLFPIIIIAFKVESIKQRGKGVCVCGLELWGEMTSFRVLGLIDQLKISPLCTLEFNRLQPRKRGGRGGGEPGRASRIE